MSPRSECRKFTIPKGEEEAFNNLLNSFANDLYPITVTKIKCPIPKATNQTKLKKEKTKNNMIWVLQGNYGHGWEDVTAEETRKAILERKSEYEDETSGSFRIVRKRE